MRFPFSKKNLEGDVSLIIDVGSSSVAVAIVQISRFKIPKVIYSFREPVPIVRDRDFKKALEAMRGTLDRLLKRTLAEGLEHLHFGEFGATKIKTAHCVLSSPWFASSTRQINVKRDESFRVTPDFISELISDEEDRFIKSEDDMYNDDSAFSRLEKHIIQMKLNGYETADPYDKLTKEVSISVFVSLAYEDLLQGIREAVAVRFSGTKTVFHTMTLASFQAIRNIFHVDSDFLIVEIGGDVTEIWLAEQGVLHEAVSFPIGGNALIRSIADSASAPISVATSALKMHMEKVDSGNGINSTPRSLNVVSEIKEKWTAEFNLAINRLGQSMVIPEKAYLITHDDFVVWATEWLKSVRFSQFAAIGQSFEVKALSTTDLTGFAEFAKTAKADPFISINSVYVSELEKNNL